MGKKRFKLVNWERFYISVYYFICTTQCISCLMEINLHVFSVKHLTHSLSLEQLSLKFLILKLAVGHSSVPFHS